MITPDNIRSICLTAIFSNNELSQLLTLKGGNALKLLGLTERQSQDLDFSISESRRLDIKSHKILFESLITKAFSDLGYQVENFKLEHRPSKRNDSIPPWWGGYFISFIILSQETFELLDDKQRQNIGAHGITIENGQKKIKIDLSFDEYTENRISYNLNGVDIFVYSPLMIVDEKIRASCQQLPEYKLSKEKERSRDLFDIYSILVSNIDDFINLDSPNNISIIKKMFDLKGVNIDLLLQFINPSIDLLNKLNSDYINKVLPQIPLDKQIDFNYLVSFNKKVFDRVYQKLK